MYWNVDLSLLIPEWYLIFSLLLIIVYLVIFSEKSNKSLILNVNILLIWYLILTLILYLNNIKYNYIIFNYLLEQNYFILIIKILMILILILFFISTLYYFKNDLNFVGYEFYLLIILALIGQFFFISSLDLLIIYISIELQSLSLYILATYKKFSFFSTEAGIKYFILGGVASGFLLFGFSMIYGLTGLTNLFDIKLFLLYKTNGFFLHSGLILSLCFCLVGFGFKLTLAPFHMWAIDVYTGVSTIVTFYFNILPKFSILIFLSKFLLVYLDGLFLFWHIILIYSSSLSIILGIFGAFLQTKLKKLIIYSGISHIGFILLGLTVGTIDGLQNLLIYWFIYIILNINIFSLLLSLRKYSSKNLYKNINILGYLYQSNFFLAVNLSLTLFSLAGIPPLAGFFSKFFILISLLKESYYFLSIFVILFSVLASIYYIRLIKIMYFNERFYNKRIFLLPLTNNFSLLISFTFLFNILFWIYPGLLVLFINKIVLFSWW